MIDIDPVVITISVATSGFLLAATTAFAKTIWWLSEQFKVNREYVSDWLGKHEDQDQHRHEDNIIRFTKIETKLDTVIKNGGSVHN